MDINQTCYQAGSSKSSIRELAAFAQKRKAEIGNENVFDFSIGNPSVSAPASVKASILKNLELPSLNLHGYTPASGLYEARHAIARALNQKYHTDYHPDDLYLTCGAAASVSIALHAVVCPGDEVIVIAPFFPEYSVWIDACGAREVIVLANQHTFDIDCEALSAAISPKTKAIIIDSPNNPVGVIYPKETLARLNELIKNAMNTFGHPLYVISDEPYRELSYGTCVPWVPDYIQTSIVCYSYSKSLSLPGERIGWVLVPSSNPYHDKLIPSVAGAGRRLGFVCAPALFQRVLIDCAQEPAPVEAYNTNRCELMHILDDLGYCYIKPQGAFYLWMRALEDDAEHFSLVARTFELMLVPSNSFGCKGWVRIGYCANLDTIKRSRKAFELLKRAYDNEH